MPIHLVRLLLLVAIALLASFAASASAAPTPRWLGQTMPPGKEAFPCTCSAWQLKDLNTAIGSYGIPYDGVIVKSAVKVGESVGAGDSFQPQTAHKSSPTSGTVASEGDTHGLSGSSNQLLRFYERFPADAGDVLGARFHTSSSFIKYTNALFASTSATDEAAGTSPGVAAGESYSGLSPGTSLRVNVEAWLEPDEDDDGYGDVSQDLCPGSPVGGSACSGSLFGSDFAGFIANSGGAGSDSLYVQTGLDGSSTALPARGVVVRWRVQSVLTADRQFQLRVLSPSGSGGYTVSGSSAEETLPKNVPAEAGEIGIYPTRLPVPAGGYLGLATGAVPTQPSLGTGIAGATLSKLADGGDGTAYVSLPATAGNVIAYDADVEPDADGDGYGDVTQDACPAAASTHVAPCPELPPETPPGDGAVGAAPSGRAGAAKGDAGVVPGPPAISGLRAAPRAFRVKAHGGGTKFKLMLSEPARVTFKIERRRLCRLKAGPAPRCKAGFQVVDRFTRQLPRGKSAVAYSGRFKARGKPASLASGRYRATAVAAVGSVRSAPARSTFIVLP